MPNSARPSRVTATDATGGGEGVVGSIGPEVHALRRERGMTLQQLAHLADVSTSAVHQVERGDMVPTIATLLTIADALDAPIRYLVEDPKLGPGAVHTRFAGFTASGPVPITGSGDAFRANGTATVVAPGDERAGLRRAGEALHFRTDLDHLTAIRGDAPAEVV